MHFLHKHPTLFRALQFAIGAALVLSIVFVNEAKGHTINCGPEPNRKAIKEQLYKNRKPLNLKTAPGDIFSRGALEELKDRKRLRRQRVNAQTDHIFQKRMVVFDRCSKHAYDHEEWHQSQMSGPAVVMEVFGSYGSQAIAVVNCECPSWSVYCENGQYLGIFQMGESERATYGHGYTYWEQAKAAFSYFVAAGSDWSPWSCQP